ncbi:LacI family DNA-binding transcriptional regulator [Streptomyces lydicus]|nr:LacI family DNA-binding transcriptional regulator [Streptomyces lydicus]
MAEVTLRDVALASGCSIATVSRVLAGTRPVGAETARTVRAAAERLGYRPNQVARALRSRSTGTVGLVLPQITNPFFPPSSGSWSTPCTPRAGRAPRRL